MKLQDKGALRPAPTLVSPGQKTARTVASWPAIISATHWDLFDRSRVDGADFYVNEAELGHIHLNEDVHLAATSELGMPLIQHGLVSPLPFGKTYGDWVSFLIRTDADADHATWLFRLNYDRLLGESMDGLIKRLGPISGSEVVTIRFRPQQLVRLIVLKAKQSAHSRGRCPALPFSVLIRPGRSRGRARLALLIGVTRSLLTVADPSF